MLGGSRALQALILHLRDRHAEAEALIDERVRSHLQLHRGVLSTVLGFQASGALAIGQPARALELAEEGLRIAEPLGDYLRVGAARSRLASIRALTGDLDGAAAAMEPILRRIDGAEDEVFVPGMAHTVGTIAVRRGDPGTAISWFSRDARSMDRGVETYLAGPALAGLGTALAAVGRLEEAEAALDQTLVVGRRLGMPGVVAEALDGQAELAAADPDALDRAVELAHAALAERLEHGLWAFVPDSLELIVVLGSRIDPVIDDVRLLAASGTARESMGLPRGVDRQAAYEAAVARLRTAIGDRFEEAWIAGMALTLAEAAAYARRARGNRGRPSTGWASLTPTELEVIRLVAEGKTNPGIGARLFMSRGTVKTHLGHVFTKLDISNRTELAKIAGRYLD